mmetsp:Transcript_49383/g.115253  ORF Transcript_49383/g.115253 Transcript_49383/m.115253 type:complete len:249 (-) Transcript_49383:135-881(-)
MLENKSPLKASTGSPQPGTNITVLWRWESTVTRALDWQDQLGRGNNLFRVHWLHTLDLMEHHPELSLVGSPSLRPGSWLLPVLTAGDLDPALKTTNGQVVVLHGEQLPSFVGPLTATFRQSPLSLLEVNDSEADNRVHSFGPAHQAELEPAFSRQLEGNFLLGTELRAKDPRRTCIVPSLQGGHSSLAQDDLQHELACLRTFWKESQQRIMYVEMERRWRCADFFNLLHELPQVWAPELPREGFGILL